MFKALLKDPNTHMAILNLFLALSLLLLPGKLFKFVSILPFLNVVVNIRTAVKAVKSV